MLLIYFYILVHAQFLSLKFIYHDINIIQTTKKVINTKTPCIVPLKLTSRITNGVLFYSELPKRFYVYYRGFITNIFHRRRLMYCEKIKNTTSQRDFFLNYDSFTERILYIFIIQIIRLPLYESVSR